MIKLDDHKVYIESHKMDMVPLSIAKQALQDVIDESTTKLDNGFQMIEKALSEINTTIKESND